MNRFLSIAVTLVTLFAIAGCATKEPADFHYPKIEFVGKAGHIFTLKKCEWISGLTCYIHYNGKLEYPSRLYFTAYDTEGKQMENSIPLWGPERLEKGETGIFTIQKWGERDPARIEIYAIWK